MCFFSNSNTYYLSYTDTKVEEGQMRIAEHTDYGTLTLLHADSPGLQVGFKFDYCKKQTK